MKIRHFLKVPVRSLIAFIKTNKTIIKKMGITDKKQYDGWTFLSLLLLTTFFIGLNIPLRVPSYAFMGLTLAGTVYLIRYRQFDGVDRRYLLVALIIPITYLANMAVHGWDSSALDRPLRFLWAVPIFLLFREIPLRLRHLLMILAMASAWMAVAGIYHVLFQGQERGFSGFLKTGPYGNYASVFFAIGIFSIFRKKASLLEPESIWAFVLLIFSAISMIISGTRSAWLGAVIMVAMICIYKICKSGFAFFYDRVMLATIAVLGVLLLLSGQYVADRLEKGVKELSSVVEAPDSGIANRTSIGQRVVSWKMGVEFFKEDPLFGVGLANFKSEVKKTVERDNLPREIEGYAGLHNFVIDHLAKTGLTGTLGMFFFWFLMFRFFFLAQGGGEDAAAARFAGFLVLAGEIAFASVGSMFASSIGSNIFIMLVTILAALSTGKVRNPAPDETAV